MTITWKSDLGSTPARVNRYTGEIQLSERFFANMPESHQKYIIEHEKAHFQKDTRSEFVADNEAFRKLAGTFPGSLKASIHSISDVLSMDNPEHHERLLNRIMLALQFDWEHYHNERALAALNKFKSLIENQKKSTMAINYNPYQATFYRDPNANDDDWDNGAGKARRQAKRDERKAKKDEKTRLKQEKSQLKNDRMAAKNEVKLSRADKNRAKGEAKKTLAEQGKSGNEYWGGIVDSVAGIFGGGKKSSGGSETAGDGGTYTEEKPKFLGMPKGLGIGVVVVVVIVVIAGIIYFVRKNK